MKKDTDVKSKTSVFINTSGLEFSDISSEKIRKYIFFENGWRYAITIKNPLWLNVSDNGHRVFDASGTSHYIPKGWKHLKWKVHDQSSNFSF